MIDIYSFTTPLTIYVMICTPGISCSSDTDDDDHTSPVVSPTPAVSPTPTPASASDLDGDGQSVAAVGTDPGDCNDNDPSIYRGAAETFYDGIDSNCNGYQDVILTIAGKTKDGYTGDGGPATLALLDPRDVMADPLGNIYIADGPNNVVRKIDSEGIITTVAGTGEVGYIADCPGFPCAQAHPLAALIRRRLLS